MRDHWDDLRLFLAVARAETLTGAGKLVRLDAATLGRRIARLERQLGKALFYKSPTGYRLTETGQNLFKRAERAEAAMHAATVGVQDHGSSEGVQSSRYLRGQVRLGAPDGCANYLLPQVCAALAAEHPELDIQIVALPRVFNLSRREADMAIGVSAPTAGSLTVQRITDYQLHFAASAGYLKDAAPLHSLADLKSHRIVGYIPDMIFDRELDYLSEAGIKRIALASNSVAVQLNLLRQSAGIGVVHSFALPSASELRPVLQRHFALKRSFYLIRHAVDRGHSVHGRFAKLLSQGLRSEVARLESEVEHISRSR